MGNREIFASRLREIRQQAGKTQKEFADMVMSTAATISAYENSTKNPSLDIVMNIAEKCNVSIDWLCGLSEKKTSSNIPQTLADIFEMLFLIQEYSDIQIYDHEGTVYTRNCDNEITGADKSTIHAIGFQPYNIDEYINDWRKMLEALFSETIDLEIYALWKEKTLTKTMAYLPNGDKIQPIPPEE